MEDGSTTIVGENFLEHYGVLGMHWGVRNDVKDVSSMSDEELNRTLKRMRLESEYKRLKGGPNANSVSNGLKFVNKHRKDIVETGATLAAISGFAATYGPKLYNIMANYAVPTASLAIKAV